MTRSKVLCLALIGFTVSLLAMASCTPVSDAADDASAVEKETVTEEEGVAAGDEAETADELEDSTPTGPPPYLTNTIMAIAVHPSSHMPFPGDAASVFDDDIPRINCCAELVDAIPDTEILAEWIYIAGEQKDLQDSVLYENLLHTGESGPFSFAQERPASGWPVGDYEIRIYSNGQLDEVIPFRVIEAPKLLIERLVAYVSGTGFEMDGQFKNIGIITLQNIVIEINTYTGSPSGIPFETYTIPLSPPTIAAGERATFNLKFQATSKVGSYTYKFLSSTGEEILYTDIEDPSALQELFYAIENGDKVRVDSMLSCKEALLNAVGPGGERVIHRAAEADQLEIAEMLIAKGADIDAADSEGYTPLHNSIYAVSQEMAELLIDSGANVNAMTNDGRTPLYVSSYMGLTEIARLLLNNGAEVDARDEYNWTPLHEAAYYGYSDLVSLLISDGANVNAKTKYADKTPLHFAANYGYLEIANSLINNGANVNAKDSDGHTPLHWANFYDHRVVAELLEQHDAYDK